MLLKEHLVGKLECRDIVLPLARDKLPAVIKAEIISIPVAVFRQEANSCCCHLSSVAFSGLVRFHFGEAAGDELL